MSKPSFKEYLTQLADESQKLSVAELRHLSGLDRAQQAELKLLWPSLSAEKRRRIVREMIELADDNVEMDFTAALIACLSDEDDEIRAIAIDGIWEDEQWSTAQVLLNSLQHDPSPRVRAAAAIGLAGFALRAELDKLTPGRGQRLREALLNAIRSQTEPLDVRRRALESVAYFSDEEIRRLIADTYKKGDQGMQASSIFAMGRNGSEEWASTIIKELKNPDPEIRFEAARAAGEVEVEGAVNALVPLLADSDSEVRVAAVGALGHIGGPIALKAIRYAQEHGDDDLKEAAAEALDEVELFADPFGVPRPRVEDEALN